jgi:hypothetical protein
MPQTTTTSIHGWVEFRDGYDWKPAVRIDELANRNYNLFGLLFGVKNHAGFSPVAANRGLPSNCSWMVRGVYEKSRDARAASWIGLDELKAIRFGSLRRNDPFFHSYHEKTGQEVSAMLALSDREHNHLHAHGALRKGPLILKIETLRRKDLLTKGWLALIAMMDCLAAAYGGAEAVRLVVWFDDSELPGLKKEIIHPTHSVYTRN